MGSTNVHSLRPGSFRTPIPPSQAEADHAQIRAVARCVANGVCLITLRKGEGRGALTAASVSLLSGEPPTILVCVRRSYEANAGFARSNRFAVNVLASDQREIAEHFSRLSHEAADDGFDTARWRPLADGLFCLSDCAAVFECEAEETFERRDSAIVIGRVKRAVIGGGSGALVRWDDAYDQLGWSRDEISRAVGLRPTGEA